MNTLLEFIGQHWLLVALFLIAFFWLIIEEARHQGMGGARKTPQSVTHLINQDGAVVVDLRDNNTFKEGHIVNSLNLPANSIDRNMNKLEKYKQNPIVLVCTMGQQSVQVMNKLKKAGFESVYILGGGLTAWKKADLPLKKDKK